MTTKSIKVCDRCGDKLEGKAGELEAIAVLPPPGGRFMTSFWPYKHLRFDLCGVCSAAFKMWLGEKHGSTD